MNIACNAPTPYVAPNVSFVATFYNKAPFVVPVLQAIEAQRGLGHTEVIIVDDGSTDNTADLIKTFIAHWPQAKLIEQANQGPAVALNNGLAACQYALVKFVEGDDIIHPDLTARLAQALHQSNAVAAYVQTATKWFGIFGNNIVPENPLPLDAPISPITLKQHCRLGVGNGTMLLCTRQAAVAAGGADVRVFVQDNSLNLRLAMQGKTVGVRLDDAIAWPAEYVGRQSAQNWQAMHDDLACIIYFITDYKTQLSFYFKQKQMARFLKRGGRALVKAKHKPHLVVLGVGFKLMGVVAEILPLPLALLKIACTLMQQAAKIRTGALGA